MTNSSADSDLALRTLKRGGLGRLGT